MGTEMALGQDQDARCPVGFKLVKSAIDDCKSALFSDSTHNILEVGRT